MYFSFVIPTFNREDEVTELLESVLKLELPSNEKFEGFEFIFADGSPTDILAPIFPKYANQLNITHIHRPRLAISPSRNLGAEHAKGDYIIFLDSDVILPQEYLIKVFENVLIEDWDSFGGPDAAHESFTPLQRAISYSMTSYFTTGGIRGQQKQIHQYNPRGFNMGIKKNIFNEMDGYSDFVCGEDIELSIRVIKAGNKVGLIPKAHVYHKRRNTIKSFFRQVYRFGAARINIAYRHEGQMKLTHMFPSAFFLFLLFGTISWFFMLELFLLYLLFVVLYTTLILIDSTIKNKSLKIGVLSILTSITQLCGYGIGFLSNFYVVHILKKREGISLGAIK